MPRRRKAVHSNKAPLIFTESPVNKQSNVPSPIYCARHPLTAKSVPVEDLHDLTWVSPQFQDNIGSSRKGKKHRKCRIASGPKCTCHCGSNPNSLRVNVPNNKFKPLKFIGEKTPPVTIIEDLSFSENIENISQQSVSPCLNRSQTVLRKSGSSRSKKISPTIPKNKRLTDNDQPNLKHSEDFDETCNNLNIGNMPVLTPVTNVIPRDVHHEPVDPNETISQSDDVLNEDDSTQTPGNNITCKSPVKRIFTSLKNSPETNVFTFIKNRKSSKKDDKHSNRILKNLFVSVCSSPSQSNKHLNILVADTPEAEYGMPYRLRRFRHRKKNDNS